MIEGSPLLLQVKQYQIFPPSNIFQSTSKDNEKFPYWEIYFRNIFKSPIKPNVQVHEPLTCLPEAGMAYALLLGAVD